MSKRYIHYRADLANLAAVQAEANSNPGAFPVGKHIVPADGAVIVVTANDGTTVTLGTVTVV